MKARTVTTWIVFATIAVGVVLFAGRVLAKDSKKPKTPPTPKLSDARRGEVYVYNRHVKETDPGFCFGILEGPDQKKCANASAPIKMDELRTDEFVSLLEDPKVVGERGAANCFSPHHGVILYDDKDNLLGTVDICFRCSRIESKLLGKRVAMIAKGPPDIGDFFRSLSVEMDDL
jgi:hypothetical protein